MRGRRCGSALCVSVTSIEDAHRDGEASCVRRRSTRFLRVCPSPSTPSATEQYQVRNIAIAVKFVLSIAQASRLTSSPMLTPITTPTCPRAGFTVRSIAPSPLPTSLR